MLYDRIINQGTINEPDGKPEPQFSLPATRNWMKSISILVSEFSYEGCRSHYKSEGKRSMGPLVENTTLEQIFLGLHHLSALEKMKGISEESDYARIGILAWYYGISNAASAMIAAKSGAFQEDHSGTARIWDHDISSKNLAIGPFGWRCSSLVEKAYKEEIKVYRGESTHDLKTVPQSSNDAKGAAASYLSGCASWYAWRELENLKTTRDFKKLGVDNFRTKVAREFRDAHYTKRPMCFLHQASRYRGKANYREALFLAYGGGVNNILEGFIEDLFIVLRAFLMMAGAFVSKKIGRDTWSDFLSDVERKRSFTISTNDLWQ